MADRVVNLKITADPSGATRAGQALVSTYGKVAQDINRQLNAITRLGGLRESVVSAGSQIDALRNRIRDLGSSLVQSSGFAKQAEDVKKLVSLQGDLATAMQKVADARARYEAAGAGIQGASPGRGQFKDLFKASAEVERLAAAAGKLAAQERTLSGALQEAGVNTSNLANEQQRLALGAAQINPLSTEYRNLTSELSKLETVLNRDKTAADALQRSLKAAGVDALNASTRGNLQAGAARLGAGQTLGIRPAADVQRDIAAVREALGVYRQLRAEGKIGFTEMGAASSAARARIAALKGELGGVVTRLEQIKGKAGGLGGVGAALGGVTGFAGLAGGVAGAYALGNFVQDSVRTDLKFQGIERALMAVTGSAIEAERSLAFVRAEADRLGTPLEIGADGFKRLAASAKGSNIELRTVKELYSGLSEASMVLGLDNDRLQGIFEAFGQIMSKGKVQAEELRGQLGDRLYGAFSLAARAMGFTTEALNAALQAGDVTADVFIKKLIPVLKEDFGAAAEEASKSAQASFGRLQTAVTNIKLEFARSGLLDDLAHAADTIADKFKDPEFINSLRAIGQTFGKMAEFVANHGPLLLKILIAAAGAKFGATIGGAIGMLGGPVGSLIGSGIGGVVGGGAALLAANSLDDFDDTTRKKQTVDERAAQLHEEIKNLATSYTQVWGSIQSGASFASGKLEADARLAEALLNDIQKRNDEIRKLYGYGAPGSTVPQGGGVDEKAAEKARKLANDNLVDIGQHFASMLKDETDLLEKQAEMKRKLNIDTLKAQGNDTAASLAEINDQYDEFLKKLGDSAEGIDLANKWFNASESAVALDAIQKEADRMIAQLQARVQNRDTRAASVSEAERARLQGENAGDVTRVSEALRALRERGNGLFGGEGNEAFTDAMNQATDAVNDLGEAVKRAAEGPIQQMFRTWQEGTRNMEQAAASWIESTVDGITEMVMGGKANFHDLAQSIIKDIIRIQIRAAIAGLAGSLFSGGFGSMFSGMSSTGTYTSNTGGMQLAEGGFVRGPGSDRSDSIAAMLSNGEFVINARAVRMFGRDTFEALNRGFLPGGANVRRYADGGYVGSGGSSGGFGTKVEIINNTGAEVKRETRNENGMQVERIVIGVLQSDFTQDGPISRLMKQKYGLQQRPR